MTKRSSLTASCCNCPTARPRGAYTNAREQAHKHTSLHGQDSSMVPGSIKLGVCLQSYDKYGFDIERAISSTPQPPKSRRTAPFRAVPAAAAAAARNETHTGHSHHELALQLALAKIRARSAETSLRNQRNRLQQRHFGAVSQLVETSYSGGQLRC